VYLKAPVVAWVYIQNSVCGKIFRYQWTVGYRCLKRSKNFVVDTTADGHRQSFCIYLHSDTRFRIYGIRCRCKA
jgi:hypothetical protein